jgi:hypothetical protein
MTTENDFLQWAVGDDANVLSQAAYAASPLVTTGVLPGVAASALANKTWRQPATMANIIAQFIIQQINQPVIDDGTTATILANFTAAILSASGNIATVNAAGNSNVTLDAAQYQAGIIELTGTLTGNIEVIFPSEYNGQWIVWNKTSAAYTIECIVSGGTGIYVAQGHTAILWGDGTNIYSARTDFSNVDTLAVSGTATGSTPTALDNSTKFATTAFAKTVGESYSAVSTVSTTGSLTTASLGKLTQVTTGATTQTFPAIATCPAGSVLSIEAQYAIGGTATTLAGNSAETIADGTGVTANTFALQAGAFAQFVSDGSKWNLVAFSANGGLGTSITSFQIITTTTTAVAGVQYIMTGSSPVALTLPASPTASQVVAVKDLTATYACTVNPNSSKIDGDSTTLTLSGKGTPLVFKYINSTIGWIAQ